jgi:hypothetical protein
MGLDSLHKYIVDILRHVHRDNPWRKWRTPAFSIKALWVHAPWNGATIVHDSHSIRHIFDMALEAVIAHKMFLDTTHHADPFFNLFARPKVHAADGAFSLSDRAIVIGNCQLLILYNAI